MGPFLYSALSWSGDSLLPSLAFTQRVFSSPLTVENRCRCWPAPKILQLTPDSAIPHRPNSAEVENDFNPRLICIAANPISAQRSQSYLRPPFFSSSVHAEHVQCTPHISDLRLLSRSAGPASSFVRSLDSNSRRNKVFGEPETHNRSILSGLGYHASDHELRQKIK